MAGLTTSEAAHIDRARSRGELFIEQPYSQYSPENHLAWRTLYERLLPKWRQFANSRFLDGIDALALDPERIPRFDDVNRFLAPRTGFRARAVSGYVPAFVFFDCLRRREFPATITIRRSDRLDYLPEPDIFHDIAGHIPMHADPAFANALVRFGDCAHTAAEIAASSPERLASIIRAMARFFWFTIEFGLMREAGAFKAYGSGLLSSAGEIDHATLSPGVQRFPVQLEWVVNQSFEIDHYQPLLFFVEGFDHLFQLVNDLESWMRQGRLDAVAPGEPEVSESDLSSFLQAETPASH